MSMFKNRIGAAWDISDDLFVRGLDDTKRQYRETKRDCCIVTVILGIACLFSLVIRALFLG